LSQLRRPRRVPAMGRAKSAPLGDVVAVVEGTPPDRAVVARSDQGATVMVAVIAGGRHMQGRAMRGMAAMAKACRVNTVEASAGDRSKRAIAAMPMATACRTNMAMARACRVKTTVVGGGPSMLLNPAMATAKASRLTRIIQSIAAMVVLAGDRTLSVTITVAVKAVPGSLRAGSLRVVVAADSGIAQAADARADDAERSADDYDDMLPPLTRATTATTATPAG
jgi:hypothetical protein